MSNVEAFSKYFLEKLGEKYWVVTLIPSVVLIMISLIVFDPIINSSSLLIIGATWSEKTVTFGLFVAITSLLVGFILYVSQRYVVKIFEGYVIFPPIRFLMVRTIRIHRDRADKLFHKITTLRKKINELEGKRQKEDETNNRIDMLKNQYYAVVAEYSQSYPRSSDAILPTGLGNILRASEEYPGIRYGMDAVIWWPRLYNLLPEETKKSIEDSVNELHVSLNFAMVCIFFYILCIDAVFIVFGTTGPSYTGFKLFIIQSITLSLRYIIAGGLALIGAGFFYRLSLFSAVAFGEQLRSAFDLHRFLLLEQMKIKPPKNSAAEFQLWKNLGELIVLGDFSLDFKTIAYDWQDKRKKQAASRIRAKL